MAGRRSQRLAGRFRLRGRRGGEEEGDVLLFVERFVGVVAAVLQLRNPVRFIGRAVSFSNSLPSFIQYSPFPCDMDAFGVMREMKDFNIFYKLKNWVCLCSAFYYDNLKEN